MLVQVLVIGLLAQSCLARPEYEDDKHMHRVSVQRGRRALTVNAREYENEASHWRQQAQLTLNAKLHQQPNTNVAKNVIMFLGDGMSLPTLAATRAYLGQLNGNPGEETVLSFEEFPYTALSKTYCVDSQVADSACSATAYLCGVKSNIATIGVDGHVSEKGCEASRNTSTHVTSIARWSQLKNKRTGIVTTTRVTHASPSGAYASTAFRYWESDNDLNMDKIDPSVCPDTAHQLIHGETGKAFHVVLGGGRGNMLPNTMKDEEGDFGRRLDGRNLIEEWRKLKSNEKAEYVWDRNGLLNVSHKTEYLLGLFEHSHCKYNLDRTDAEPTLAEMTEAAINILNRGENGYFLFVEGGRIDHAHHDTKAHKALDETVQFAAAVKRARELTDESNTLIVVTSDHAHTMSVSGYPVRGNDIFGFGSEMADDKLPYATLSYANGPSYRAEKEGRRHDVSKDNMKDKDYEFPSLAPLEYETHGGDDVGIFANGPWAHLFRGTMEQNVIPHIMAYASCVGNGITACDHLHKKH